MTKTLIALSAGIITGILLAPAPGNETRRKMTRWKDDCKGKWNSALYAAANKVNSITNSVDQIADTTEERLENLQFPEEQRPGF